MRVLCLLRTAVAALSLICLSGPTASAETFSFVALGDMPYGDKTKSHPAFRSLIDTVNARAPAFTIHVGDIKSGSESCTDEVFALQLQFMNSFERALIYTPGDNEWTDCHREKAGKFDPLERLGRLRAMFFPKPLSLGKAPIALERQSDVMNEHRRFVENARFSRSGIQFLTLHVVGSNNGLEPRDRRVAKEFFDRDEANLAWLADGFAKAKRDSAKGIVIAMQADMFEFDFGHFGRDQHLAHSGFLNVAEMLVREALEFGRPALLIYGDSHNFRVHTPFRKRAPQMVALEVFGADQMHAVEVLVNPSGPALLSFRPIWNTKP